MRKKRVRYSLQGRIIAYNLIIVVLVAMIGSVAVYHSALKRSAELAKQSMSEKSRAISENLELACTEMMNIVLNCMERRTMKLDTLDFSQEASQKRQALVNAELLSDYCAVSGYGSYILRLMLADSSGNFIQSGSSAGSRDDFERLRASDWFAREEEKETAAYPVDVEESPFFKEQGKNIIPILRRVGTAGNPYGEGWIFLEVSAELFQDELQGADTGNALAAAAHDGTIIAQVPGEGFSENSLEEVTERLVADSRMQGVDEVTAGGRQCFLAFFKSAKTGVIVYELMPVDKIYNERAVMLYLAMFLFLCCCLIGALLSVVFSSRLRKPVNLLSAQIRRIGEGDFSENPLIEGEDELGEIGRGINEMSGRIGRLLQKSVEDEREKKDLEIRMLQAQINPHFLYNTLDSIRWIAVIQKNASIVKMVSALVSLLKNMAKGFNEKVTLGEELKFLEDYVTIEKMRYMEMFDVEIQVSEESLYAARIIKLTLQPLVENAIFSGIEPGGKNGLIRIMAWEENKELRISVWDNGVGIPQEKLPGLLHENPEKKRDSMSGIGLPNVHQRIRLVYGEPYGLSIESREGEYTEILVRLPLEYE